MRLNSGITTEIHKPHEKLSSNGVGGPYGVRRRRKGTTVLLVSFFVWTYDLFHQRLQYRHFVLQTIKSFFVRRLSMIFVRR